MKKLISIPASLPSSYRTCLVFLLDDKQTSTVILHIAMREPCTKLILAELRLAKYCESNAIALTDS